MVTLKNKTSSNIQGVGFLVLAILILSLQGLAVKWIGGIMSGLGLVWAGGMYFNARAYSTAQASGPHLNIQICLSM